MKDNNFICKCNSTSKQGCICEYDFGLEAMQELDENFWDEANKCAELIKRKRITPNQDNF